MVGWIILGVIVLIITVINLIPIGVDAAYEEGEFRLAAMAAGVKLQLLPKEESDEPNPKKEKKPKKPKKKKEPPKEESSGEKPAKKGLPLGLNKEELVELIKKALQGLGKFPRKFCVDRFKLHFTAAGNDPYHTAMTYGYVNEALSILLPLARNAFTVRHSDVRTNVDFTRDSMEISFALGLSIRIGQIVGGVLGIVFPVLGVVIKSKLRQKREAKALKKNAAQTEPASSEHTEIKDTENNQAEERKDSNG